MSKIPLCKRCIGQSGSIMSMYNEQFDAYFCPHCDQWLESKCGCTKEDPKGCWFQCWLRPDKPSEVKRDH